MEAICDPQIYIWYFNFGEPGSLNDINMLDRSSVVGAILAQQVDTMVADYSLSGHV